MCDIFSGVNGMTTAKTALHTSNECDMYAHVSPYDMTGDWEWIGKFFRISLRCFTFFLTVLLNVIEQKRPYMQMGSLIHSLDSHALTLQNQLITAGSWLNINGLTKDVLQFMSEMIQLVDQSMKLEVEVSTIKA
jgi:hypothetical protein